MVPNRMLPMLPMSARAAVHAKWPRECVRLGEVFFFVGTLRWLLFCTVLTSCGCGDAHSPQYSGS
jgi:hypothetical protein